MRACLGWSGRWSSGGLGEGAQARGFGDGGEGAVHVAVLVCSGGLGDGGAHERADCAADREREGVADGALVGFLLEQEARLLVAAGDGGGEGPHEALAGVVSVGHGGLRGSGGGGGARRGDERGL